MEEEVNNKKLYVGGINYDTNEEALQNHFAQAGTVESAVIIIDKMTNRSKGFGFVEMSSEEEAQKAIEMLDGQEFDGRTLKISIARPMRKRFDDRNDNFGGSQE